MSKLTKRVVDAAEVRAREYFIWDEDLPGFGLRVLPSGRKRYIIQYRAGRRSRRISLGPSTVLTCEQARSRAITIIAATKNGDDPAARRDADRHAITVKELAERFDKEHIALRLKPSTAKGYKRMLERFVIPRLGNHRVTEVTRADVAQAPSRPPAHPLRRQSLPGDDLQDVQPRRDVGPASGRHQSAQAHQEIPGGEARAVPEPRRTASVSARCCARWSRKASSSPPPSPPFAC